MLSNRRRALQVNLLPLALDDASADLGRCFSPLVLQIGIVKLLQASGAFGSMRTFKAAVQALMAGTVAVAIAGLLMNNAGNLRSQLIGVRLIGKLSIVAEEYPSRQF